MEENIRPVIILGAGASAPFTNPSISTALIDDAIWDLGKWKVFLAHFFSSVPDQYQFDPEMILKIVQYLNGQVKEKNFENVIEIVDKISSYNSIPYQETLTFHKILEISGAKKLEELFPTERTQGDDKVNVWPLIPFLYRQLIAETVEDIYENHRIGNYEELLKRHFDFIRFIH